MYASVRRHKVSSVDETMQRVNEGFVPLISKGPGFIAYYALDAGDGAVASISLFETQAGAEESNRMAANWVKENIAPLISGPAEITAGEVKVDKVA